MRCFVLCPALSGLLTSWLVFLSTHTVYADELNGVTMQLTGLGEIRGTLNISAWTNRTIYQFQGIPFAKPPVGNLRFKPPEPAEPWNGTLDATKFGRKCPVIRRSQHEFMKEWDSHAKTENIEDCLNLNVYTPHLQNESLGLPVMVYIHGGSFRVGSAQEFWPNYLLERDVVLVVPQYRLGPLGFLSLQTEDVPGNVGLLDQVLALRWIQKYITQFGGDPGQVTVFGQSAGGAAVTLMQISPLVDKSLFGKIIIQSGSALGTWVMDRNPAKSAVAIARLANCNHTDLQDLAVCLRQISAQDLLIAHSKFLVTFKVLWNLINYNDFFSVSSDPAPADYVPSWPPVRTETGPYLRIDRISEVRKNFLEEYTIAMTEGLGPSKAALEVTSVCLLRYHVVVLHSELLGIG